MPVPPGGTLDRQAIPDRDDPGLYDRDFHAWTLAQAAHLRDGRLEALDLPHLLDELEIMGASEKRAIKSNLRIVLLHLLKYQAQPERRSRSWHASIREHRLRLADALAASPSLRGYLAEAMADAYPAAVRLAMDETALPREAFPAKCPFTADQALDEDFLPPG